MADENETRESNGRFAPGNPGNPTGRALRQHDGPTEIVRDGVRMATAEAMAWQAKRDELQRALIHVDAGWTNWLTGMGTAQDKRTHTYFRANRVSWPEAVELWTGNPLAARVIEMRPFEMLRTATEVRIAKDVLKSAKDTCESVADLWRDIGLRANVKEGLNYNNAYGGGAVLLGANDGTDDLSLPLDDERVHDLTWCNAMEPRELIPIYYYADARSPKFGQPAVYQLTPLVPGSPVEGYDKIQHATQIHESRLLTWRGIRVSRAQVQSGALTFPGWGDTRLTRCADVLKDYGLAWGHAAQLVVDFAQPVYQFEGLASMMESEEGRQLITARLMTMDKARSILRAMLLDSKDSYHRETTPMGGISDLLAGFERQFCMAVDAPSLLVFGNQVGGLGNTDAGVIQLWYDRVMAERVDLLEQPFRRVAKMSMRSLDAMPKRFSVFFAPLYQMSEKETAELRKTVAETDDTNIANGVYTADEARESHYSGDEWSMEVHVTCDEDDEPSDEDIASYTAEQDGNNRSLAEAKTVAQTAMLGPQVEQMMGVVTKVLAGSISRETGAAILRIAFSLSEEDANAVLGPDDFEPALPPAPMVPPGGALPNKPPIAKPAVPPEAVAPEPPKADK